MAQPRRLLLAEDDPVSRAFLQQALAGAGHAVSVACDGEAALAMARARRFDLLLFDLHLPGCNGPTVLQRLRDDAGAASCRVPAFALTAETDAAVQARLRAGGFARVLDKPLSIDALLQAVDGSDDARGDLRTDPSTAPAPVSERLPAWDDAASLAAVNGNADIAHRLRELMLCELPQQLAGTVTAIDRRDTAAAQAELHRLRASCSFCGARDLAAAVERLSAALAGGGDVDAARAGFERACERLLQREPMAP